MGVAFGVEFTAHLMLAFMTCTLEDKDARVREAMKHMLPPTINGACSTIVSVIPLLLGNFEFVTKYMFVPCIVLVVAALINGSLLMPILLKLVGPPCVITAAAADKDNKANAIAQQAPPATTAELDAALSQVANADNKAKANL